MNTAKILQSVGLNPNDSIFSLDNNEVMEKIFEFIKEWNLKIDIKKISKKDWEIFLPFEFSHENLQLVLKLCRKYMLIDWHVVFPAPTDKQPKPKMRIYWDRASTE